MLFGRPKLPVTQADKEWIENSFFWIEKEFGKSFLKKVSLPYTFSCIGEGQTQSATLDVAKPSNSPIMNDKNFENKDTQ